MKLDWLFRI